MSDTTEPDNAIATGKPAKPKPLSALARCYIAFFIVIGIFGAAASCVGMHIAARDRLIVYMLAGIVAAMLKVQLPGITGTMSVNFIFVLLSIVDLSAPEASLLAAAGVAIQYAWQSKARLRLVQLAFNLSNIIIATLVAAAVFHSPLLRRLPLDQAPVLCLVATAYFLMNTLPVAVVVALTEERAIAVIWKEYYFWSYPYYIVGAGIVAIVESISARAGWQTGLMVLPFVYVIYRSYNLYMGRLAAEKTHAEEMAGLHLRTIEALALAIDAKDQTTNDHLQRVRVYAEEIGKELKLSPKELTALQAASLLHDIGKLAVPEHIISKPGKLTPEEFEKMKIHPIVGAEILERVEFPYPVVPIVAAHHEKWDGTGYPYGLSGEEIPVGARILSAVDCLDALASDRQYRRALPLEEAMQIVRQQSGTAFDPNVVDILERRYKELEMMARAANTARTKLSTDVKVVRGAAPDAGFEEIAEAGAGPKPRFLSSIAAASNEAQTLLELSKALGSSLSLSETLSAFGEGLQQVVPFDGLAIYTITDGELKAEHTSGQDAGLFSRLAIPVGQGLSGWVAETGKTIINGNPSVEPGYLNDQTAFSTLRSALAIPLDGASSRVGVLTLYRKDRNAFTRDDLRIILAVGPRLSASIENSLKFRAAEDSAVTDHLTGLPNARSLFLHLEGQVVRAGKEGLSLTALVCDLDGFKQVNDVYGHLEGNRVLCEVADVLRSTCRESDYVARMGGDEFVIILSGADQIQAQTTVSRIRKAVAASARRMFGSEVFAISIGSANFMPGMRPEDLMDDADRDMYRVKALQKRRRTGTSADALMQTAATDGSGVSPSAR